MDRAARLATLGELSDAEIGRAEAADHSLAGALAALGCAPCGRRRRRRSGPGSQLRDDAHLSNHGALSVAGGFWAAPDLDLVRP